MKTLQLLMVVQLVLCRKDSLLLTSSTVGTFPPAASRALHRAESEAQARLSRTCSSMAFRCFTMSRDRRSSERMNTSITCMRHKQLQSAAAQSARRKLAGAPNSRSPIQRRPAINSTQDAQKAL